MILNPMRGMNAPVSPGPNVGADRTGKVDLD